LRERYRGYFTIIATDFIRLSIILSDLLSLTSVEVLNAQLLKLGEGSGEVLLPALSVLGV
jgi:hypothetical protein